MKALNWCKREGALTARHWSAMLTICALTTMPANADVRRQDASATQHKGHQCAGQGVSSSLNGLASKNTNPVYLRWVNNLTLRHHRSSPCQGAYRDTQAVADEAVPQSTNTERQDSPSPSPRTHSPRQIRTKPTRRATPKRTRPILACKARAHRYRPKTRRPRQRHQRSDCLSPPKPRRRS